MRLSPDEGMGVEGISQNVLVAHDFFADGPVLRFWQDALHDR
ncbi:hypothetical protein [uncultured Cohaesibacter sp.]|nr:hypothetical protein [uncultured Cohaesibacter sp.]